MTDYFLDTSALVKRYAPEPGSDWVRHITNSETENTILLAEITLAELSAALAAKQRTSRTLTFQQTERILSRFLQDCDESFLLLPVDRPVIELAVELPHRHHLRGYDSVQLATALALNHILQLQNLSGPIFVASDQALLAAAKAEQLLVENLMDHQ